MPLFNHQSKSRRVLLAALFASLVVMSGINAALAGSAHKLKVDGLACPYCSYGIEKQLSGLAGVKSVRVSISERHLVRIRKALDALVSACPRKGAAELCSILAAMESGKRPTCRSRSERKNGNP